MIGSMSSLSNEFVRKLPKDIDINLYTEMHVCFLYKRDTDVERTILYAMSQGRGTKDSVWYIPSAQAFIINPSDDNLLCDLLPVYIYPGRAQSKIDKDVKYNMCSGTMHFHTVVPKYLWP